MKEKEKINMYNLVSGPTHRKIINNKHFLFREEDDSKEHIIRHVMSTSMSFKITPCICLLRLDNKHAQNLSVYPRLMRPLPCLFVFV